MVVKVYKVTYTIPAGAGWTRFQSLSTPTGYTRTVRELRIYFSAASGAAIRIYYETEFIAEVSAEVWNKYALPYYMDLVVPAGRSLYFEGQNSGTSPVTVIIEVVVEEAAA